MNVYFMEKALEFARISYNHGDVPIGAVVVKNNKIIGYGYNKKELLKSPVAHAEILAIQNASIFLNSYHLEDCDLYVTLEPCLMCVGAIINSRIKNLYFGAYNKRYGAVVSHVNLLNNGGFNHITNYKGGILEKESSEIISSFFKNLRAKKVILKDKEGSHLKDL